MRGLSSLRRRKDQAGRGGSPTWQDNMPSRDTGPSQSRYVHIPEIDRWRAVPFAMTPPPNRPIVMEEVRQHVRSLEGAIDEGTGASLDRLIESWAGSWIATVESEYVDHCAVISVHRGQAQEWLTEATVNARHEREELDQIRADYLASRRRLTGEPADPAPSDGPPGMSVADSGPGEPYAEETVPHPGPGSTRDDAPGPVPVRREDWSAPHLVADRSRVALVLVGILVLIGALADTVVFKNILELILRQESESVAWLLAAGAAGTCPPGTGPRGCP